MTTLSTIATILYTMVVLTLIGNFIRLFVDSRNLRAEGKTPLVGRTAFTIVVAALVEFLVINAIIGITAHLGLSMTLVVAVIVFVIVYYARQVAAYLATWGTWSIFVRRAKKKEIEKIQQEVNKRPSN